MGRSNTTKIDVVRRINTPTAPFRFAIYALTNGEFIIEKPDDGFCARISERDVTKYIKTDQASIDTIKLIDNSYIAIVNSIVYFTKKITHEIEWVNLEINVSGLIVNDFSDENFSYRTVEERKYNRVIQGKFPMLPVWITTTQKHTRSNDRSYNPIVPRGVFLEYKNTFYRFPYGNVDQRSGLCFGGVHREYATSESFYANFICSGFNEDYIFPLNKNYDVKPDEILLEFNLDYIHNQIMNRTGKITNEQLFYYLTQLEEVKDFDFGLVFLHNPKTPWEYR